MMVAGIVATLAMLVSLVLIPLGVPGLWIMVAIVGLGAFVGAVGWGVVLLVVAVAAVAELLELLLVRRMSLRYGGSRTAFWGALVGGFIGVIIGFPLPVIGPVVAGLLGSFAGAGLVSLAESRDVAASARVGWGVLLARALAAGLKVAAGIIVLLVGGTAWIV